jgi:predicted nuclease with TOPRIM domain
MAESFQIVEDAYTLLDETSRLKEKWYESKDSIESAKQMGITAQGYIDSMKAT